MLARRALALALVLASIGAHSVTGAPQTYSSSSSSSVFTSSVSSSSSSSAGASASPIRLRANRLRRPEACREQLPRKHEDLPALVVVGRVKEVYMAAAAPAGPAPVPIAGEPNRALVTVGRVLKGAQALLGADIIVSGFNSSSATPCPNYVKPNDTLILLLEPAGPADDRRYSVHANNLLAMNLNNLDRVNALAADEPYKRRPAIEDILCEAHYCAYGRCVVLSEQPARVDCKCPDSCASTGAPGEPVCGSDNATYANECQLIREGCRLRKPLFVTKSSAC